MYRDAADHDYLLARFSARSNLIYQFWWNAQQSTEKYLKAILLLNSIPVTRYSHKITEMFDKAVEIAGDLLPILLCPPSCFRPHNNYSNNRRGFLPTTDFIIRIEANGNPNNRYRMFSTHTQSNDLIFYDQLSFALRRIAFPLDLRLSTTGRYAHDELRMNPTVQLHHRMGFQGHLEKKYENIWGDYFSWCNFAYFYEASLEKGEIPRWGGAINAEPYLSLSGGNEPGRHAMRWIAENGFPRPLKNRIIERIDHLNRNSN